MFRLLRKFCSDLRFPKFPSIISQIIKIPIKKNKIPTSYKKFAKLYTS